MRNNFTFSFTPGIITNSLSLTKSSSQAREEGIGTGIWNNAMTWDDSAPWIDG